MTMREMERRLDEVRRTVWETACSLMTENPHWKRRLNEAPIAVRPFVRALFVTSVLAWLEPREEDWRTITSDMSADDWRHLARTCGNPMARAQYLQCAEKVRAEGRPIAMRGGEILNPFVNLPEGGAA